MPWHPPSLLASWRGAKGRAGNHSLGQPCSAVAAVMTFLGLAPLPIISCQTWKEDVRVRAQGSVDITGGHLLIYKNHEQFRIVRWKLDELYCQFLVAPAPLGSLHPMLMLHCNITESYPSSSPIWFMDCDDPNLATDLERLKDMKNNSLRHQLKWLTYELSKLYNFPKHLNVELLYQPLHGS